jgi:hypothetical protein
MLNLYPLTLEEGVNISSQATNKMVVGSNTKLSHLSIHVHGIQNCHDNL